MQQIAKTFLQVLQCFFETLTILQNYKCWIYIYAYHGWTGETEEHAVGVAKHEVGMWIIVNVDI